LPSKTIIESGSSIEYDSSYQLSIDENAIVGTTFIDASFLSLLDNYIFRTETDPRPKIVSYSPENGSPNVGFIDTITLTFNEDISDDIAYSGVQFRINGESQDVSNIDVSGQNVTVTLSSFVDDVSYSLIIPNNVFRDFSNNYFAGLFDYEIGT
jgi:hypothetical protein